MVIGFYFLSNIIFMAFWEMNKKQKRKYRYIIFIFLWKVYYWV